MLSLVSSKRSTKNNMEWTWSMVILTATDGTTAGSVLVLSIRSPIPLRRTSTFWNAIQNSRIAVFLPQNLKGFRQYSISQIGILIFSSSVMTLGAVGRHGHDVVWENSWAKSHWVYGLDHVSIGCKIQMLQFSGNLHVIFSQHLHVYSCKGLL